MGRSTNDAADPAVERAVKVVREVRRQLALLLELADRAEERGYGAEADRIVNDFFDERMEYEEALERLKRLAEG